MPRNPLKLKVAYLYPDILQGFCDIANVNAFVQRARQRDIEVSLCEIQRNDKIQAAKYDFYYIGGADTAGVTPAVNSLKQNKEELKFAAFSKVPMLVVGIGYMLFGSSFQFYNMVETEGIKILNVKSVSAKERIYKPVIGYCDFLNNETIVGFLNSDILNIPKTNSTPFIKLKGSSKQKRTNETEGIKANNVIGTAITSALLPQNPHLCDYLIATALRIKYECEIPLTPLCDDIECYSHKFMLELK